ncbi:MAG: NUDIX hydrolase [Bryobacteraceae bacterium]
MLGVGALLFDDAHRILLVERGREPLKGFWSLPGGVLETGETLSAGIQREVLEETGLRIDSLQPIEIFERIMLDEQNRTEYHYVLIDYIGRVTGGVLAPGDDVSNVRWAGKQELAGIRLTEGTLAVIEKAYDILLCTAPAPIYSSSKS